MSLLINATWPRRIALTILLSAFFSFHWVQAQTENTTLTVKALRMRGLSGSDGESNYEYRFNTWFNGNRNPNCINYSNVNRKQWYAIPSGDVFRISNAPTTISADMDFEVQAHEEDGCGSSCSYDTDCGGSDEHKCRRSIATTSLYDYVPGNYPHAPNVFIKDLCLGTITIFNITDSTGYRIQLQIIYAPPAPKAPEITVQGRGTLTSSTSELICDNPLVSLATTTSINPVYKSFVNYTWKYRINGETYENAIPNPNYCTTGCDTGGGGGGGGGDVPMESSIAKLKGKSKTTQNIPAPIVEPGVPPPCCYEPPYLYQTLPLWRTISGTTNAGDGNEGVKEFLLRSLSGLTNITSNTKVIFQAIPDANGVTGAASPSSFIVNISPVAPVIGNIIPDPTCPNSTSGVIHLSNVTGFGDYRYVIKSGLNNTAPCNPDIDGSCLTGLRSGTFDGTSFDAPNITNGDYTFWLANPGGTRGSCYTTKNVTVGRIADLSIQLASATNVDCNGTSTGNISLTKTGGIAPYSFTVNGVGTNSTGIFPNLPAGPYTTSVTDGCGQNNGPTVRGVTIKQPNKLSESVFSLENATCVSPGNGQITTSVSKSSGTYDSAVSSLFLYRVFKGGALYSTSESSSPSMTRSNLPVGSNYTLVVTEKGSGDCNSYTKPFAINAPNPLSISNPAIQNVNCFDGIDGAVSFSGSGGSNQFMFKLAKTAGDTIANSTGNFSSLGAGNYKLVIENDLPGCFDKANYPSTIPVTQPDSIAISLAKTNITCFGSNNGTIAAVVAGGTPSYSYNWEKFIGSSWNTISTSSGTISNQSSGTYRLRITDGKSCPDVSSAVVIVEPSLLGIGSKTINDIKCFGEKGTINVVSTGGTQPYSYSYSLDNGVTFTSFTNTTPLNAGTYKVKAVDQNGCSFTDPSTLSITAPPSPADYTYQQSDFNGFNISCFGGSNGSITLAGTGGNGGSYSGYRYAIDGGSFQSINTINNINAGSHSISTIDGRGCVVSKTIPFTQSAEAITVELVNKQDVVCYGDLTGVFNVQGSGGVSPYSFSIDGLPIQTSTQFTSLGVGSHTFQITDLNGCSASDTKAILNLNPRVLFQSVVENVKCFGGTDGSIAVNVSQGAAPFQFTWPGQSSTTSQLNNVGQGTYSVTITDNNGCTRDSSFTVSQPAQALSMNIQTKPICFGSTDGEVTIIALGGTSPYQYSLDNGSNFQSSNFFNSIGAGAYTVKIQDTNDCEFSGPAEVFQRNDRPEPNFLVATRQNAFDTLIIKEISVPKPDSIDWSFDSNAVVISDDPWEPQIKFTDPGTYSISMVGFFGGCDYQVIKSLTLNPYDPNAGPASNEGDYRTIQSVEISPNPNTGEFDLRVKLLKKNNLSIVVYDMIGTKHFNSNWDRIEDLDQRISLPQAAAGIYLLRVITDTDARDIRVIINK